MKAIETGIFNGIKYELFNVRDCCGFCEIIYRTEPNYHKHCKLFFKSDINSELVYNFLKPHIEKFYN